MGLGLTSASSFMRASLVPPRLVKAAKLNAITDQLDTQVTACWPSGRAREKWRKKHQLKTCRFLQALPFSDPPLPTSHPTCPQGKRIQSKCSFLTKVGNRKRKKRCPLSLKNLGRGVLPLPHCRTSEQVCFCALWLSVSSAEHVSQTK